MLALHENAPIDVTHLKKIVKINGVYDPVSRYTFISCTAMYLKPHTKALINDIVGITTGNR